MSEMNPNYGMHMDTIVSSPWIYSAPTTLSDEEVWLKCLSMVIEYENPEKEADKLLKKFKKRFRKEHLYGS